MTKQIILGMFGFILLFLSGCEDKPLLFESTDSVNKNITFSTQSGSDSQKKLNQLASNLIVQAQEKIDKAEYKYNKALRQTGKVTLELELVRVKIDDAIIAQSTAKHLMSLNQFKLSTIYSKQSKNLASVALQLCILA
ncbi:hypothetical protein ACFL0J_08470 [Candidatus Neomarinimicrobiota bacterium]